MVSAPLPKSIGGISSSPIDRFWEVFRSISPEFEIASIGRDASSFSKVAGGLRTPKLVSSDGQGAGPTAAPSSTAHERNGSLSQAFDCLAIGVTCEVNPVNWLTFLAI
jgi:hypothetical protein